MVVGILVAGLATSLEACIFALGQVEICQLALGALNANDSTPMSQTPHGRNEFDHDRELIQNQEVYRLRQEHARLRAAQRRARLAWVRNTITLLVGALLVLLAIRFFLRLSSANPDNPFAQLIYSLSAPFMTPFSTLFISPTDADATRIFDLNNLIAMIVYGLLGGLGVALVNYLQGPGAQGR